MSRCYVYLELRGTLRWADRAPARQLTRAYLELHVEHYCMSMCSARIDILNTVFVAVERLGWLANDPPFSKSHLKLVAGVFVAKNINTCSPS